MKFLSIYKSVETGAPPTPEDMERMGKLIEEGMKAGYLLAVEGCLPSAKGARVRLSNGKVTVTDGPFTESKGDRRRARHPAGRVQGSRYRARPPLPGRRRRRRVRGAAAVRSGRQRAAAARGVVAPAVAGTPGIRPCRGRARRSALRRRLLRGVRGQPGPSTRIARKPAGLPTFGAVTSRPGLSSWTTGLASPDRLNPLDAT